MLTSGESGGGGGVPPSRVFFRKFHKILCWHPSEGWRPLLRVILNPPLLTVIQLSICFYHQWHHCLWFWHKDISSLWPGAGYNHSHYKQEPAFNHVTWHVINKFLLLLESVRWQKYKGYIYCAALRFAPLPFSYVPGHEPILTTMCSWFPRIMYICGKLLIKCRHSAGFGPWWRFSWSIESFMEYFEILHHFKLHALLHFTWSINCKMLERCGLFKWQFIFVSCNAFDEKVIFLKKFSNLVKNISNRNNNIIFGIHAGCFQEIVQLFEASVHVTNHKHSPVSDFLVAQSSVFRFVNFSSNSLFNIRCHVAKFDWERPGFLYRKRLAVQWTRFALFWNLKKATLWIERVRSECHSSLVALSNDGQKFPNRIANSRTYFKARERLDFLK